MRAVRWAALAPLVLGGLAGRALGDDQPALVEVSRILRDQRGPDVTEGSADRLAEASRTSPELLVEILETRRVPALEDEGPQVLNRYQEVLLLDALARVDRPSVRRLALAGLAGDLGRRCSAMKLVGRVGSSSDLTRVLDGSLERGLPDRRETSAFREAVRGVLQRDLGAYMALTSRHPADWDVLLPELVRAVGEAGHPQGLELLEQVVQWSPEHELLAITQIPLVVEPGTTISTELIETLRRRAVDPETRSCAASIVALGRLRDEESVASLIEVMEAGSPASSDAHWALRSITGLNLPADARSWRTWYREEMEWLRRDSQRVVGMLGSTSMRSVAHALQELGRHRLHRSRMAEAVEDVVAHPDVRLRRLACAVLGSLAAERSREVLEVALEDEDEGVRKAAAEALRALDG